MAFTVGTEACTASLAWTGVEGVFVPGFPALDPTHIAVTYQPTAGPAVALVPGIHFSVAIDAAGAVTLTPIAMPAAPGVVTIDRRTPSVQTTNFINLGSFSPDIHTQLHDQAAMAIAELRRDLARAVLGQVAPASITILPPAGVNTGLIIRQALTGIAGATAWNGITITSDNVAGAFLVDFQVQHFFGGPAARGTRVPIFGSIIQTAITDTSGANSSRFYVGLQGLAQTNTGDGGSNTGAGAFGGYYGGNFLARVQGLNLNAVIGSEFDVMGAAGTTVHNVFGIFISNFMLSTGANADAGICIASGSLQAANLNGGPWGPGNGFGMGVMFGEIGVAVPPLVSTATVIGTHIETLGSFTVANGVDFRGFNFTGLAWASTGAKLDGTGFLDLNRNASAASVSASVAGSILRIAGLDGQGTPFVSDSFGSGSSYVMRRANGTAAVRTGLVLNDVIGQFLCEGWTSAAAYSGIAANIRGIATETWTGAANGSQLDFRTTPNTTNVLATAMSIFNSGGVGVGAGAVDPGINALLATDLYTNNATFLLRTKTALTNGAAAAAGTLTNAPAAGNPTKWISVDDNGTTRKIPAW